MHKLTEEGEIMLDVLMEDLLDKGGLNPVNRSRLLILLGIKEQGRLPGWWGDTFDLPDWLRNKVVYVEV